MHNLILEDGTIIKYSECYSRNGVHIDIQDKVTDEQKDEIKKKLKSERDLLSLKFWV